MSQHVDAESISLPPELQSKLDGNAAQVAAWAMYDIDCDGRLTRRFLALLPEALVMLDGDRLERIPVEQIGKASIQEGLGVDRLVLLDGDKELAAFPYSRHCRREMTRLHRKLERQLPGENGKSREKTPDWLLAVERQAEKKEVCGKCGQLIPAYAEGVCPACLHKKAILWRLLEVAKPYRWKIRVALLLTLMLAPLTAANPLVIKRLIDGAIGAPGATGPRLQQLAIWSGVMFVIIAFNEITAALRTRVLATIGTCVTRDLRHRVYAHLHELSLRYFSKRRTGSLITRVTNDTDRLWDFIVFGSVNFVRDIFTILVCAGVLLWMNWELALLSLIPIPALAAVTYYRGRQMQRLFGRLWTYWSRMSAVVGDAIPGVRVVKAFANERREVGRFDERNDEYTVKEQEVNRIWTQLQPVVGGMMRASSLMVWIVGGYLVIARPNERNTVGTLLAFSQTLWQFYMPIMELANSNRMVTRAASSAQRVFEVLDTPPEIYSNNSAVRKEKLAGRIELRNISFSYEGAQPALREVSLAIEPGEMVGLCGPSGAGKTTLVNLVCRFYDPTDGQVLIDGTDLRDYDVKWLRRQVGVVLQEPYLFHGTIADNIRYGNPQATLEEIIRAAKAANAHDFVVGFPDGYDTIVGERGQSLSGGERQRISIARAILHDPKILILDEATSSVDTETEKQIQEALDRLVEGRTTIAIAHRLSTLLAADRLVVLEKGKVAETGTHEELVNKEGGVYAKLHKTQVEMSMLVAIR
jgi:ATP-binding cassette subfamily B protein